MKAVAVLAHLDDLETSMAGFSFKFIDAGHELVSVVTTPAANVDMRHIRVAEGQQSHGILGILPVTLQYLEQQLHVNKETRQEFAELIKDLSPEVVFIHSAHDTNPDHRATSILAQEPCLLKGVNTELFCVEVFSGVGRPQSLGFYPSHYVDITDVVERKKELIFCHQSQNPEAIWKAQIEMQKRRGLEISVQHAEAFIRLTRYGELNSELGKFFTPSPFRLPHRMGVEVDPKAIGL